MAEANKTNAKAQPEQKMEKIMIPRASAHDDPNMFVSINGVNYLLPRGKESEVPDYVAAEIRRAWQAEADFDEACAERAALAQQPVNQI